MKKQKLNEVAKVIAGQSPPSSTYNSIGKGLPFFQGKADFQEKYPRERVWCTSLKRKEAKPGDILMSVRAPVGPVNICNQLAVIGRGISAIRPLDGIYGEYLYYYFKANEKIISSYGTGSTFKAITQVTLNKFEVPIPYRDGKPDLDEQIRIATLLSRVEALIATRKNNLQQLDDFLKSTFLEIFGDPNKNDKGWDKAELSIFGSISTGNTPPRNNSNNYGATYVEWIKTDNIDKDLMYITQAKEYLSEQGATKARILNSGAVLVACIAGSIESIGRAAITDRTVAFNQQINAIQPNKDVDSIFLYWLLRISQKYIQGIPLKGMKKIITKGVFEKIKLIKPPYEIQESFSKNAIKVYALKQRYQESLQNLENLYAALSQKAFKGELDLSRVPFPEDAPKVNEGTLIDEIPVTDEGIHIVEYPMKDPIERTKLLHNLFDEFLTQHKGGNLSLDDFWQQASFKTIDLIDEFDKPWGVEDYDQVKDWLFELIRNGGLKQKFVGNTGSPPDGQIELKIKANQR